jgi:hypothetical protein
MTATLPMRLAFVSGVYFAGVHLIIPSEILPGIFDSILVGSNN